MPHFRGCSGEPNLLPRAYHSGASDDLAEVIGHLQAKRPLAPLYAVGYSLGGNVLLKYLGESGIGSPLRKAVAVSVPFRLDQCADRIGLGFSRVYQAHFMKAMVAYVKDKQQRFQHEGLTEHLGALQVQAQGTGGGLREELTRARTLDAGGIDPMAVRECALEVAAERIRITERLNQRGAGRVDHAVIGGEAGSGRPHRSMLPARRIFRCSCITP